MGDTVIQPGSPQANKIFNAALFTEAVRRNSMTNMLTGGAPKVTSKNKTDARKQTESGAPIVRITDLAKSAGEEVTMDLFHQLGGLPTMGDRKLEGRVEALTSATFDLKINQGRKAVSSGGKMTQQRTSHDLVRVAKTMVGGWWSRLDDQMTLIHMAGARGDDAKADWAIPLATHPEFADIVVNPITPPTYDRHVIGGDAADFGSIDSADKFTLAEVDKLRLILDEMAFPLQPVSFEKDPMADDSPFHVLMVSPRQWNDFWTSTNGAMWRELTANAQTRRRDFNHPIFTGECAMWNGILIKKMTRPITFNTGSTVDLCTNSANAAVTQDTAGTKIERAVLLGAQAVATAFGRQGEKSKGGGMYFGMVTKEVDFDNAKEHAVAWMNGKKKIRFAGTDGRINDHGVMALDTAVST